MIQLVRSKGEIDARFKDLRITHAFSDRAFAILDQMRECKRKSRPEAEQNAGTFFGESNIGKSTTIEMYLRTRVVDDCLDRGLWPRNSNRDDVFKLQRLVLRIVLPSNTTLKSLAVAMLITLGDPRPHEGNINAQLYRARKLMEMHGVELIIIDECDHLRVPLPRTNHNREEATSVHNHLKNLLIGGFPILFVGIPRSRQKIFNEDQMIKREMYRIVFDDLNYANKFHYEMFREFCTDLGIILQEKGIMPDLSCFIDNKTLMCLFVAGGKSIGGVVRIVQRASELAFEHGSTNVKWEHLEAANDQITGFCNYNPFREGLRSV